MTLHTLEKKQIISIMIGVMLGVLLAALDNTIVSTAMPSIIKSLNGMEYYTWPFTAYMLCSTIVIPLSGSLGDMVGKKPVYIGGIIFFLVASALCGLSQSMIQLIIFRGLQGVGGGIILSNAFALVGEIFPPRDRGKYMGAVASMFGLSSIIGPSLGGWITEHIGWSWIFYINLPVGIIGLLTMYFALPNIEPQVQNKKFDWAGLFVFIIAMVPMLLGLTWSGRDYAWDSPTIIILLSSSIIMLIVFAFVERKAANPLLPPVFFNNSIFNVSLTATFLSNIAFFTAIIYLPLYAQMVMGKTASGTGTIITPMMLSFVVAAIATGRIVSKTGRYKIVAIIGFIIAVAGTLLCTQLHATSSDGQLIGCMIVMGLGLGATTPVFNIAVQNAFPQRQIGTVSAALQFFRSLGASIGAAVLGSVFSSIMKNEMTNQFAKMPHPANGGAGIMPQGADMMKGMMKVANQDAMQQMLSKLPKPMADMIMGFIKTALTTAVQDIFWIAVGTVAIGTVAAFMLKEIPLRETMEHGENMENPTANALHETV